VDIAFGEPPEQAFQVGAGVVGQLVGGVEDRVDARALVTADRVGDRPDYFVAGGLDAVIQEWTRCR
jgi:hypothetical protein